jgi:hypothetical protein
MKCPHSFRRPVLAMSLEINSSKIFIPFINSFYSVNIVGINTEFKISYVYLFQNL